MENKHFYSYVEKVIKIHDSAIKKKETIHE